MIRVGILGATGYTALDDATVAERSEALYGGREEGSGL